MKESPESPKPKKEILFTPQESHLRIQIERELMERWMEQNKELWMEKNAEKYRKIFDPKKDKWLKLYRENSEAALQQLQKMIDNQP